MDISPAKLINIGIINLTLVATIGLIMRYKIGFEFPYLDQKYLLHAHSHFAFSGWVTHILLVLMVLFLRGQAPKVLKTKRYLFLILSNLLCAYGMLFSFAIQGYGAVSIVFSTLSVLVGYLFTWYYWHDLNQIPGAHPSKNWFKAALWFNVLSSLGTFYLAYIMMTKHIHQHAYLASVYFYLHFQYSGWFFFAIMGLLMAKLVALPDFKYDSTVFIIFFAACIPAYLLSVLWLKLPWYLFVIPVLAVVLQLYGLLRLLLLLKNNYLHILTLWIRPVRIVLGLSLIALIIKFLLQAGSIFPDISKLAFGFRTIVIAYLHLVLLGVTTLFLLGYILWCGYLRPSRMVIWALFVFAAGVFANEVALTVQGVASFGYILIPYMNEVLLAISLMMWASLITLLFSHTK